MAPRLSLLALLGLSILVAMTFSAPVSAAACDAAVPWQFGFQDPASPVAEGIIRFHHDLMFILILVVVFVTWMLVRIALQFDQANMRFGSNVVHGAELEVIWTLIPAAILALIAIPSFGLLYAVDEVVDSALTVKIIGHQWYWSYEYSDYSDEDGEPLAFDSYMVAEEDLTRGQLRLLEVDNPMVIPVRTHLRLIITAADVLHCWTIPSMGVKLDACPGRLNQVALYVDREGMFVGQCSEICGQGHGMMPIVLFSVTMDEFLAWVTTGTPEFDVAEELVLDDVSMVGLEPESDDFGVALVVTPTEAVIGAGPKEDLEVLEEVVFAKEAKEQEAAMEVVELDENGEVIMQGVKGVSDEDLVAELRRRLAEEIIDREERERVIRILGERGYEPTAESDASEEVAEYTPGFRRDAEHLAAETKYLSTLTKKEQEAYWEEDKSFYEANKDKAPEVLTITDGSVK